MANVVVVIHVAVVLAQGSMRWFRMPIATMPSRPGWTAVVSMWAFLHDMKDHEEFEATTCEGIALPLHEVAGTTLAQEVGPLASIVHLQSLSCLGRVYMNRILSDY